jgi:hypothetical protein
MTASLICSLRIKDTAARGIASYHPESQRFPLDPSPVEIELQLGLASLGWLRNTINYLRFK